MLLPADTQDTDWSPENLAMWKEDNVTRLDGRDREGRRRSIRLEPLEAKALHVFGLLVQTFDAAGHVLYCGTNRPYGNYYMHAYLLACTAIELFARCKNGDQDLLNRPNDALRDGFEYCKLGEKHTNIGEIYDLDKLVALRNYVGHGRGVASVNRKTRPVVLSIELLDTFPDRLLGAFDDYYEAIFKAQDSGDRKNLAVSGVEPVVYDEKSKQVFISPIRYAYEKIYLPKKLPGQVVKFRNWMVPGER